MIIYLIHKFRGAGLSVEREANKQSIARLARTVVGLGHCVLSPVHCLGFLDDANPAEREIALQLCEKLLSLADEAWVFGDYTSEGCIRELMQLQRLRKPFRFVSQTEAWWPKEAVVVG